MIYSEEELKFRLRLSLQFISQFKHFGKHYIIEYFTDNHWEKLPQTWQETLQDEDLSSLANCLLIPGAPVYGLTQVWPLSLLAFRKLSHFLSIKRELSSGRILNENHRKSEKTKNKLVDYVHWKHMKPKKRHEISSLSEVIAKISSQSKAASIIDVGSGQGHLSRILTLNYKLSVKSIEREERLVKCARKFDDEVLQKIVDFERKESDSWQPQMPTHLQMSLSPDVESETFLEDLRSAAGGNSADNRHFLLTGLHACGDLSATMVRLFKESSSIKSLISVSCCYMKLTTDCINNDACDVTRSSQIYYPMSDYVKSLENHELCYEFRKLACHSNEDYLRKVEEDPSSLKGQCYRAMLEVLIRRSHPELIRTGVKTIKNCHRLSFLEYSKKAFKKLGLSCPDEATIESNEMTEMLQMWPNVVKLFMISLVLAPVVESIILLDRVLYLKENGYESELLSIFEPLLSPRCFAVVASKNEVE
ncbi:methyltransferase-like protein 25B isoform X2 [Clavelina lepadiformis]|uniref:methyltransferase-like protein 25B isoform X2 n=1 Tax=Clavelina lepadiformis TaxID=159417 RepID=UPI0040418D3A